MKDITEIMAVVQNDTTKKMIRAASEVKLDRQPTPSFGLNMALGGGIGFGRYTLIWGSKSSGKSSLCLGTIAEAQKDGVVAAWIDAERSYDPEWASRFGVDNEKVIHVPANSIEAAFDAAYELAEAGVGIIVVDSISSLIPSSFFDKKGIVKPLEDTRQIGTRSKDLMGALDKLSLVMDNTAVILISQVRNAIGGMHVYQKPTGGNAVEHLASTIIKLSGKSSENDQIMGTLHRGDKVYQAPVGRTVDWLVTKNKLGPPFKSGSYDLYYDGEFIGIDTASDLINVAMMHGVVERGGAWYNIYGEKFQGIVSAAKYLRENPDVAEKIKAEITNV